MSTPQTVPEHQKPRRPRAVQKQVDEANKILDDLKAKPGEGAPAAAAPAAEPAKEPAAPAAPAAQVPDPAAAAPAAEPAKEPAAAPAAPDLAKQLEQANQRYTTLKGKYDKEIPELRALLGEEQEKNRQNDALLKQLADKGRDAPAAPAARKGEVPTPAGFTKEEMDEYGPEFFNVVGRRAQEIADAQLGPLKKQIEELTGKLSMRDRVDQETQRMSVVEALDLQVPDWKTQNTDQKFLAWLEDADVFSGRKKRELLTEAFNSNDAARVVRFFKAFQEDAAQAPAAAARTPSVDPAALVAPGTPRNAGTTAAPGGDARIISQQEITAFYADVRRGVYASNPVEKARKEREYVKAAAEGRVR